MNLAENLIFVNFCLGKPHKKIISLMAGKGLAIKKKEFNFFLNVFFFILLPLLLILLNRKTRILARLFV